MSWPKPEIQEIALPNKPRVWLWGGILFSMVLASIIVFSLLWPNDSSLFGISFWLCVLFVPFGIFVISLAVRFYIYGLDWEKSQVWRLEKERIDQDWQEWAMQSLVIVDSVFITAGDCSCKQILFDRSNIATKSKQILSFDIFEDGRDYQYFFEEILLSLKNTLSGLSSGLTLSVKILTPNIDVMILKPEFERVYTQLGIQQSLSVSYDIIDGADSVTIENFIDEQEEKLQLLIINNLDSREQNTTFISAFLVAPNDLVKQDSIKGQARLFRPMQAEEIADSLEQMQEIQPVINNINHVWLSNCNKEQEIDILKSFSELKIDVPGDNLYYLDLFNGQAGPFHYWLAMAFAAEATNILQESQFIGAVGDGNKTVFTVLEPL